MRFMRDYELIITFNDDVLVIRPEIRIQFEAQKSIYGKLNNCSVKIYNLSENKRKRIVKDKTDTNVKIGFLLKAGYDRLQTIFKGDIWEAYSVRAGVDIITNIKSIDGAFGYVNSYTSKVVKGSDYRKLLADDLIGLQSGYMCKAPELFRPRVLVGNTYKLFEESLQDDESLYIDEEKLYIIKDDEIIDEFIAIVNAETGLMGTPIRKEQEVSFVSLINPTIRIGGLVKLESVTAKHLNGLYKVHTIK